MDESRNTFFPITIKLVSVKPERCMTDCLKPNVIMSRIVFFLRRSENPIFERLIEVFGVGTMTRTVLEFYSICSSAILCFEMHISEEQADERFTLNVGKLQQRFASFNFPGIHLH